MDIETTKLNDILKIKRKRIWFEHIKRRPLLIKEMSSIWKQSHQERCEIMKNTSLKVFPYKDYEFSQEELRIIKTPIDELIAEYKQNKTPQNLN